MKTNRKLLLGGGLATGIGLLAYGIYEVFKPKTSSTSPASTYLEGTVTDKSTGQPISKVQLELTGEGYSSTATTDSSGYFLFSGLPATGPYTLAFTATGYQTAPVTVTIVEGQNEKNLALSLVSLPSGSIEGITTPSGASMYVDGTYAGTTPFTAQNIDTGAHTVKFTLSGYQDDTEDVVVLEGKTASLEVDLIPIVTTGSIKITSNIASSNVYLYGALQGQTPLTLTDVSPGTYKVTVGKDGYQSYVQTVTVVTGKTATVNATLTPNPAPTLTQIMITPGSVSTTIGNTQQFTAAGYYSDGSNADLTGKVSWQSSNAGIASIGSTGLMDAIGQGNCNITASISGITSNSVPVAVIYPIYPAFQYSNLQASTVLSWPGSSWASVIVKATVTNNSNEAITHTIDVWGTYGSPPATVDVGNIYPYVFREQVSLGPGQSQDLTFGPGTQLAILSPSAGGGTWWVADEDGNKSQNVVG